MPLPHPRSIPAHTLQRNGYTQLGIHVHTSEGGKHACNSAGSGLGSRLRAHAARFARAGPRSFSAVNACTAIRRVVTLARGELPEAVTFPTTLLACIVVCRRECGLGCGRLTAAAPLSALHW